MNEGCEASSAAPPTADHNKGPKICTQNHHVNCQATGRNQPNKCKSRRRTKASHCWSWRHFATRDESGSIISLSHDHRMDMDLISALLSLFVMSFHVLVTQVVFRKQLYYTVLKLMLILDKILINTFQGKFFFLHYKSILIPVRKKF